MTAPISADEARLARFGGRSRLEDNLNADPSFGVDVISDIAAEVERLTAEVERLQAWIADLTKDDGELSCEDLCMARCAGPCGGRGFATLSDEGEK